jgi:hypothetical protein
MSEDAVTELRKELGEKAGRAGEKLHDSASREFSESYRRGNLGFGSNVTPKAFGKGSTDITTWTCVCGEVNRSNRVAKRAGVVVCWLCGTERSYGEDKDEA